MHAAGDLVAKGLNTSRIIDDTFYRKTFIQNKVHGRALIESELTMEGKVIYSVISENILESYGAKGSDLDGTIDQLRMTEGVECAILMHQTGQDVYKISMRSNDIVNVSTIAASFGGGGHVRASGCTMYGLPNSILEKLFTKIKEQLVEAGCLSCEE